MNVEWIEKNLRLVVKYAIEDDTQALSDLFHAFKVAVESSMLRSYFDGVAFGKAQSEKGYDAGYKQGVENVKHELMPQEKAYERGYDHGLAAGIAKVKVEAATNYPDVAEDYRRGYTEGSTHAIKSMLHLVENPVKTTFYIEKDFKLKPIADAPKDGRMILGYFVGLQCAREDSPCEIIRWDSDEKIWVIANPYFRLDYRLCTENLTHFIEIPQSIENISNSPIIDRETLLHSQPANDSTLHFRSDNSNKKFTVEQIINKFCKNRDNQKE